MLEAQARRVPEQRLPSALYETLESFGLFSPEHPRCLACLTLLTELITKVQQKYGGEAVIGLMDEEFICGSSRFPARERELILLKEKLESARIGYIRFSEGITKEELLALLRVLLRNTDSRVLRDVPRELREAGVNRVTCEDVYLPRQGASGVKAKGAPSIWERVRPLDDRLYWHVFNTMKLLRTKILHREIPNAYKIKTAVETLVPAIWTNPDELLAVVFRPQEEDWVLAHAVRSCILALRLGIELTDDDTTLHLLAESMLLNDIGLFTVPSSVLYKRGTLTENEQETIEKHPIEGASMLLTGIDFSPATVEASLLHHAIPGGMGYPCVAKSTKPSVVCRISHIMDAYECIVGGRPYRGPRSPMEAAAELLRGAGTSFDGALVGRFIQTIGLAPVGSLAVLSDGSIGEVVVHNKDDLLRPTVALLLDEKSCPVTNGTTVVLAQEDDLTVASTLPLDTSFDYSLEYTYQ